MAVAPLGCLLQVSGESSSREAEADSLVGQDFSVEATNSYVVATVRGAVNILANAAECLAWLCAAVRDSPEANLSLSGVELKAAKPEMSASTTDLELLRDKIEVEVGLSKLEPLKELQPLEGSCWHALFENTVIVKEPSALKRAYGKGLELSFETMVHLSGVEKPMRYGNSFILLGYSTLLYPTKRYDEGSLQWHLKVSEKERIQF